MYDYQFFYYDKVGEIIDTAELACSDDDAALAWAKGVKKGAASVEVWCGSRCIHQAHGCNHFDVTTASGFALGTATRDPFALERFRLLWYRTQGNPA